MNSFGSESISLTFAPTHVEEDALTSTQFLDKEVDFEDAVEVEEDVAGIFAIEGDKADFLSRAKADDSAFEFRDVLFILAGVVCRGLRHVVFRVHVGCVSCNK